MKSSAHIIGAGGIGIAAAVCLARAGWDGTMIESNPEKVAAGRRNEMTLDGQPIHGTHFVHFDDWIPPKEAAVKVSVSTCLPLPLLRATYFRWNTLRILAHSNQRN